MAITFYNNDEDPTKKVGAAGTSSVSGTSSDVSAPQPKQPIPIAKAEKKIDATKVEITTATSSTVPNESTIDDKYEELKRRLLNGEKLENLTEEERNLIKSYEERHNDNKPNVVVAENIPPEKLKRMQKYGKITKDNTRTQYQKTSDIIDIYLQEYDSKYKKLKTEEAKKAYRDGIIHDLQAVVNPNIKNKDLTVKQRKAGLTQIAEMFIFCEKNNKPIEYYTSMSYKDLQNELAKNEYEIVHKVMDKADTDNPNLSAYQKLDKLADVMLEKDAKYSALNDEEKEKFREQTLINVVSKLFKADVSADFLKDPQNEQLLTASIELVKVLEKDKIGITQFQGLNIDQQAKIIVKALKRTQNKLPDDQQKFMDYSIARFQAIADLGKADATERDVMKFLQRKSDRTEEDDKVLKNYELLSKNAPKVLNEKAELSSIVTLAGLTGTGPKKIAQARLNYYLKGKENIDDLFNDKRFCHFVHELNITGDSSTDHAMIKEIAEKYGIKEEDVIARFEKLGHTGTRASANAYAMGDSDKISKAQLFASALKDENNQKIALNLTKAGSAIIDEKTAKEVETNPLSERIANNNPDLVNAKWAGYRANAGFSAQSLTNIQDAIQNAGFSDDYKQFSIKSMTSNATAEQQRHIINYYENTTDKNIIKGLAAAEQSIYDSVKQEYSEKLDRIIQNNGLQNDKEIQTARETGQTSYEREQAQRVSAENSDQNAGNSAANTSSKSKVSTTQQGSSVSSTSTSPREVKVTTGVLYISAESKTYTKDIRATLAQLDSENKKTDAMKKVADNIAKIQAENLKYEEAAEKKKTAEQKQLAENIKKENEAKTEEQLKAELSSVLDGEIADIENEISNSPEAAEVQKQLGSMFEELRAYAKAGQMDQVFSMLGKIPNAQEKFLEKLATKHISTITHFIKGADKSILKFMCEKNPGIISTLDTNTLMTLSNSGFPKTMLIKYGDKNQIAGMFKDLQGTNNGRKELEGFYEIMGLGKDEQDTSDASGLIKKNYNLEGGDDFMNKLRENMKNASNEYSSSGTVGSTVVPSWKEPDKKVPRELWG